MKRPLFSVILLVTSNYLHFTSGNGNENQLARNPNYLNILADYERQCSENDQSCGPDFNCKDCELSKTVKKITKFNSANEFRQLVKDYVILRKSQPQKTGLESELEKLKKEQIGSKESKNKGIAMTNFNVFSLLVTISSSRTIRKFEIFLRWMLLYYFNLYLINRIKRYLNH